MSNTSRTALLAVIIVFCFASMAFIPMCNAEEKDATNDVTHILINGATKEYPAAVCDWDAKTSTMEINGESANDEVTLDYISFYGYNYKITNFNLVINCNVIVNSYSSGNNLDCIYSDVGLTITGSGKLKVSTEFEAPGAGLEGKCYGIRGSNILTIDGTNGLGVDVDVKLGADKTANMICGLYAVDDLTIINCDNLKVTVNGGDDFDCYCLSGINVYLLNSDNVSLYVKGTVSQQEQNAKAVIQAVYATHSLIIYDCYDMKVEAISTKDLTMGLCVWSKDSDETDNTIFIMNSDNMTIVADSGSTDMSVNALGISDGAGNPNVRCLINIVGCDNMSITAKNGYSASCIAASNFAKHDEKQICKVTLNNCDKMSLKVDCNAGTGVFSAGQIAAKEMPDLKIAFSEYTAGSYALIALDSFDSVEIAEGDNIKYGTVTGFDYSTMIITVDWSDVYFDGCNIVKADGEMVIKNAEPVSNSGSGLWLIVAVLCIAIVFAILVFWIVLRKSKS